MIGKLLQGSGRLMKLYIKLMFSWILFMIESTIKDKRKGIQIN